MVASKRPSRRSGIGGTAARRFPRGFLPLILAPILLLPAFASLAPAEEPAPKGVPSATEGKDPAAEAAPSKPPAADGKTKETPKEPLEAEVDLRLKEAFQHALRGREAEAEETYAACEAERPVQAALGLAALEVRRGRLAEAQDRLDALLKKHPKAWEAQAARAELDYGRGKLSEALERAEKILHPKAQPDSVQAHWLKARILRDTGDLAAAEAELLWCVRHYNRVEELGVEDLRRVGQAAAEYARWKRNHEQFSFLVNRLKAEMLKLEPDYAPAHEFAGRLYMEKFNELEAEKELQKAISLDPTSPAIQAAVGALAVQNYQWDKAKRALSKAIERNPNLIEARLLIADVALSNFRTGEALSVLEDCLLRNPRHEETLGRIAACYRILDGNAADAEDSRYQKLRRLVESRNPHCGVFYFEMGRALETRRLFDEARGAFEEAVEKMPQLTAPPAELAMLLLRLGEEKEAKIQLEAAFERDPFHVRVANSLKVMEILDGYDTLESEHFIFRFAGPRDRILAEAAIKHLEEIYPVLCNQFHYQLPGKSLIEIFSKTRNTSGHGWFSARMTGMPYLGTVGACAGRMVAMASPNEQPYHWGRVVQHEFIHLVNLRQTSFNLPHWFAEGIATHMEGFPRPPSWNKLLRKRFLEKEMFTLENINLGFMRPGAGDDWQMAYCQSELYVEYMQERFGDDAVAKLLAAYSDRLDTPEALPKAFSVDQKDFEAGFHTYIKKIVESIRDSAASEALLSPEDLQTALAAKPEDPDLLAQLAWRKWEAKQYPAARGAAEKALAASPKQPLAHLTMARIALLTGDGAEARTHLEAGWDAEKPSGRILLALADLDVQAKDFPSAEKRYTQGREAFPADPQWLQGLARVHLLSKDDAKLLPILEEMALRDSENLTVRKKLAQMAHASGNAERAARWARETLFISILDADAHHWLGAALRKLKKLADARRELELAVQLAASDVAAQAELGMVHLDLGDAPAAAKIAAALSKRKAPGAAAEPKVVQEFLVRFANAGPAAAEPK